MFEVVRQDGLCKLDLVVDNERAALTGPADQGAIGLIVDQLPEFVEKSGWRPGRICRRDSCCGQLRF